MRASILAVAAALMFVGCQAAAAPAQSQAPGPTGSPPSPTPSTPSPTAVYSFPALGEDPGATLTPAPVVTPEATDTPTPKVTYAKLSSRSWKLVVKSPDSYDGKGYQIWACISQFDAATGPDEFRAEASYTTQAYWYSDGVNAIFDADTADLSAFVEGDMVVMNVVVEGAYTYDTQAGGSATAPSFYVEKISRKGSC